ncbi:transcriptional regulator [Frankia sp. EI5c]|uniref:TetR/AcrR family transcriptional regulator n=1 Tax=Frankia sp. EI5c TaxID=683316 RepID=UPI0007C3B045|nr:TetR/AcrR family transcriptional regulator [Frankia sp. EI5c]OAA27421.1 transcriptional regulator [Frankia sp. EI5c]
MTLSGARGRVLDEKQRASASEILDAAAKAFSQRGYAATSIDDVADVLGCTKGRIYHYFRTKGDLFIGIHRQSVEWALEAVAPVAEQADLEAAQRLREMVRRHAMHLMEKADYMRPAQHHAEMNLASEGRDKREAVQQIFELRRQFEAYFTDVMTAGIAAGQFRDADPNVLVKAVLGTTNWMSVWFRAGGPTDTPAERERIAEELAEYAMRGVLA